MSSHDIGMCDPRTLFATALLAVCAACSEPVIGTAEAASGPQRQLAAPLANDDPQQPRTLSDGTRVTLLEVGRGLPAGAGDTLVVHYTLTRIRTERPAVEAEPSIHHGDEPSGEQTPADAADAASAEPIEDDARTVDQVNGQAQGGRAEPQPPPSPDAGSGDEAPNPHAAAAELREIREVLASTSASGVPARFELGAGQWMASLERALIGARAGSRLQVELPPALGAEEGADQAVQERLVADVRVVRVTPRR